MSDFDLIALGEKIRELRENRGITRGDFEELSDFMISESTLKRIENGEKSDVGIITLWNIADVLKVNVFELFDVVSADKSKMHDIEPACSIVADLYDSKSVLMDIAEHNTESDQSDENEIIVEEFSETYKSYLGSITAMQRLMYPCLPPNDNKYWSSFNIKTLAQFFVFLPLMDSAILNDAFQRVECDIFGREDYFLLQIDRAYKSIPDSPAKKFADYWAHRLTYEYFALSNSEILRESATIESVLFSDAALTKSKYLMDGMNDYLRLVKTFRISFGYT